MREHPVTFKNATPNAFSRSRSESSTAPLSATELETTKLEVAAAAVELAADVKAAFYTAQYVAEIARRQFAAGNITELDLASERALYEQARLELARAEEETMAAREELTALLGLWGVSGRPFRPGACGPHPLLLEKPTEHLREIHRVMKHSGVCVLGFRPKEDPAAASFPETVYTFYPREVVRDLLFDVGFANIALSEPAPGLVLARAVKN